MLWLIKHIGKYENSDFRHENDRLEKTFAELHKKLYINYVESVYAHK
jgi:hypothetical protein